MAIGIITGSGTYALPGFEGDGPEPVKTRVGRRRSSRAGRSPASTSLHVSRHDAGPRAAVQPRHASRQHRRARGSRRRRESSPSPSAARSTRRVELGSLICFDDLHFPVNRLPDGSLCTFYDRAGRPAARPLDLRGPVRAAAARARCSARRPRGRPAGARRRLLRPRRRPALQHQGRDPRARRRGRDRGLADRRARRPCSPARPSCRSRSSATRPTTPTACRPRRRRSSALLELIAASTDAFASLLADGAAADRRRGARAGRRRVPLPRGVGRAGRARDRPCARRGRRARGPRAAARAGGGRRSRRC